MVPRGMVTDAYFLLAVGGEINLVDEGYDPTVMFLPGKVVLAAEAHIMCEAFIQGFGIEVI